MLSSSSTVASPVRAPAVAGLFYPEQAGDLRAEVSDLMKMNARLRAGEGEAGVSSAPRALIAPHAGFRFSGAVAAAAFDPVVKHPAEVVFLLGPAHRVYVSGFALPAARSFRTPLGEVQLDAAICQRLLTEFGVVESAEAHEREHSIEVELPFLQAAWGSDFRIVPLLVGDARPEVVARLFEAFFDTPGVLFVVSSDLSHFLDYESGRLRDEKTMERIVGLQAPDLNGEDACGCRAVNGLMEFASHAGLVPRQLGLESSGDRGGPRSRVVGYGAVGFWSEGGT